LRWNYANTNELLCKVKKLWNGLAFNFITEINEVSISLQNLFLFWALLWFVIIWTSSQTIRGQFLKQERWEGVMHRRCFKQIRKIISKITQLLLRFSLLYNLLRNSISQLLVSRPLKKMHLQSSQGKKFENDLGKF